MKWIRRICVLGLTIMAIYFITSIIQQHNEQKRLDALTQIMEKAAQHEKSFADNQMGLSEEAAKEKELYDLLMSFQVENEQEIKETANAALTAIEKQQYYLDGSKESLKKAYKVMTSSEPIIKKVRGSKPAKTVFSMKKLNGERYQIYLTYTEDYQSVIALNKKLYKQIEQQHFNEKELDEQIKKMNQLYKELHKQEKQFNQYTAKVNKAKKQYYQLKQI